MDLKKEMLAKAKRPGVYQNILKCFVPKGDNSFRFPSNSQASTKKGKETYFFVLICLVNHNKTLGRGVKMQ
jgi:hypothetical protein